MLSMAKNTPIIEPLAKAWDVITCPIGHPCYISMREFHVMDYTSCEALLPINGTVRVGDKYKYITAAVCRGCGLYIFPWRSEFSRFGLYNRGKLR